MVQGFLATPNSESSSIVTGYDGKTRNSEALFCSKTLKVEFSSNGFGFSGTSLHREVKLNQMKDFTFDWKTDLEIWGFHMLEVLDPEGNLLTIEVSKSIYQFEKIEGFEF